jgi:hypothetical protein
MSNLDQPVVDARKDDGWWLKVSFIISEKIIDDALSHL